MTTSTRRAHAPAWVLAFLAAVLAVVLGAFTAGPASALTASAAQNAVGASTPTAQVAVEPSASITAGPRLGNDPPQPRTVVATGVAANGGMAGVRPTGATGEAMAGIVKNTTRIPSASGKAAYRIPDELNSSVLGEVKNVKSLGWSSQISDFYNYATARGQFRLYVRPDTVFRGQLAKLYEYDGFTRVDVPGMGP